jgi:hypothetical protein
MEEEPYPWREALISCGVLTLTAGLMLSLLVMAAALVLIWS